jgi:Acetyltransferase (GNAT) domain
MATSSLEKYNRSLAAVRERFDANPALHAVRANNDPQMLELFLLYFCAIGAQMTQPVEGWIRRAASRCAELGFEELAKALNRHAQAESGHHLMMIADVHSLVKHWNSRHSRSINADDLLNQVSSNGARSYCEVHERNIAGNTPYAQVAIEYEIEQLPLRYGSLFLARCFEVFGPEILPSLSFVSAHIDLDIGHTHFNERELAKLIDSAPESLSALVAAGTAALDAYAEFLNDCLALAQRHYSAITNSSSRPSRFLSWQLQPPLAISVPESSEPIPTWLEQSRSLRGAVFFDNGRRPRFQRAAGGYHDPDPIDPYAWHVLAYHGSSLAGCVRVYPLNESGPPCLTESLLGREQFARMLGSFGRKREHVIEIGRWVVDPAFRNGRSLAPGIGLELAAGAGALAVALASQIESGKGIAIFAAGTRDRQYLTLTHLGLKVVSGLSPVRSSEYDDFIQVLYCDSAMVLQPRFRRIIESLSMAMRMEQVVNSVGNRTLFSSSASD